MAQCVLCPCLQRNKSDFPPVMTCCAWQSEQVQFSLGTEI